MARIDGVQTEKVERQIGAVFEAQEERWGGPLLNHLIYARRPTIFRGARGCGPASTPRACSTSSKFNRAVRVPSQGLWDLVRKEKGGQ